MPHRERLTTCNGERPSCNRCRVRRLLCHYPTQPGETRRRAVSRDHREVKQEVRIHEELIRLLRNLPDQDAQDVFQRLRSGTDAATVLNHIKAGDALVQMAVVPEARLRYDFPYRMEMPEYLKYNNPYMDSLIYEAASLYSPSDAFRPPEQATSRPGTSLSLAQHQSLYTKPFHAVQVIDPKLSDLKLSAWTSVCKDDGLMRQLLEHFFRCEYQFTAAFQKDLFLEDVDARRTDFCSPLLVNILFAYSCVRHALRLDGGTHADSDAVPRSAIHDSRTELRTGTLTLLYRFLAEAKRLWELENAEPRITTMQAGILFSVFHNLCGLDEIGQPYRIQAVVLARKLRIFDTMVDNQSDRLRRGREYAAWAMYNWET
ncbi:hypothetical protein Daus18300_005572 [Diaporthe australafricana]|uniref:Zn(2)-C6 fungal-type domain-containing protein n=1 Tax=Diaporthe australafricana TaxID=127596 RepID=A0ABR3X0Q3_9PEZI